MKFTIIPILLTILLAISPITTALNHLSIEQNQNLTDGTITDKEEKKIFNLYDVETYYWAFIFGKYKDIQYNEDKPAIILSDDRISGFGIFEYFDHRGPAVRIFFMGTNIYSIQGVDNFTGIITRHYIFGYIECHEMYGHE